MSAANVLKIYDQADTFERDHGLTYFRLTRNRLDWYSRQYGFELYQCIGAFCALSPSNDEAGNYRDLHNTLKAAVARMQYESFNVSTWGPNKLKAWRILRYGEKPLVVLGGKKVRSFYQNILDPDDPLPVTIDGHCFNIWRGERVKLVRRDRKPDDGLKYEVVADGYRKAAKEVSLLPNQLQATVWHTWKRIHRILYNPQMKMFDAFTAPSFPG